MMNCIIIDDEPLAIEIIASYCKSMGSLNVLKTFPNAIDALNYINSDANIDLIFCDIEMPNISGIDFIKSLQGTIPSIIFTTAYPQYALEGYELSIVDYLVKPIPFPRFVKAVNKVRPLQQFKAPETVVNLSSTGSNHNSSDAFIFVKSEYENVRISLANILYIEGLKDYLKIHIKDSKSVLTLMNFKSIQAKLPEKGFLRVHRSYIVNIDKIKSIQKNKVIINNVRIPIGESYKNMVYNRFGI